MTAIGPERRAALVGAKLGALVRERWGDAVRLPVPFGGGAALVEGDTGWVLADASPARVLGGALAWARPHGLARLHLLVDDQAGAGIVARRAVAFTCAPEVWLVDGRDLRAASVSPFPERRPAPRGTDHLCTMLAESGVEVVVEHGEVSGEVRGLEIARVVFGNDGTPRLEVGVGRHDREAFAMIHGDLPTRKALESVVDTVLAQRRPGMAPHPLNRLAAERWLRAQLVAEPMIVGARMYSPVDPPIRRDNVKDAVPAAALGEDEAGRPLLVVCSAGIDLDLVPAAADARAWHAPDARLVLVVPERDAHPVTRFLASSLVDPADVVTVASNWRDAVTVIT